jgi:hypothetical protein
MSEFSQGQSDDGGGHSAATGSNKGLARFYMDLFEDGMEGIFT